MKSGRRGQYVVLPLGEMAERYAQGEGLQSLASAYGVAIGTVWNRLHALGVKMHPSGGRHKPGGPLFLDGKGYLNTNDRTHRMVLVHRACFAAYYGSIPEGYVIHHVDGDIFNNAIGNLVCMPHGEHSRMHRKGGRSARILG